MTATITTLKLPMPMRMGNVNCYLLHSECGLFPHRHGELERA